MRSWILVLAVFAVLMPAPARAGRDLCGHPRPPQVTVRTVAAPTMFDTKQNAAALARLPNDTAAGPVSPGVMTAGSMQGRIASDHKITFGRAANRARGVACIWVEKIEITLRVDPKIYLAHELHNDACRFGAVFGHEAEHAAADAALVESYRTKIRDGLILAFATPSDYESGPVSLAQTDRAQDRFGRTVTAAVSVLFDMMTRERAARQRHIDSPSEYRRLSGSC